MSNTDKIIIVGDFIVGECRIDIVGYAACIKGKDESMHKSGGVFESGDLYIST